MNGHENASEVARLQQRITDECLAAKQGLSGLCSGSARHQFITARMERMGECHDKLKCLVGEREATRIIARILEDL